MIGNVNQGEQLVADELEARGFTVLRNGWPDFLVRGPSGRAFGVEVKSGTDVLRPAQVEMHYALTRAGIFTVLAHTYEGRVVPMNLGAELAGLSYIDDRERAALVQIGFVSEGSRRRSLTQHRDLHDRDVARVRERLRERGVDLPPSAYERDPQREVEREIEAKLDRERNRRVRERERPRPVRTVDESRATAHERVACRRCGAGVGESCVDIRKLTPLKFSHSRRVREDRYGERLDEREPWHPDRVGVS